MILVPVYYRCPLLCNQLLNGLTRSLKPLSLDAGKDFDVVAFSINPDETPELAARRRRPIWSGTTGPATEAGWHFLTGEQASIAALTEGDRVSLHVQPADQALRPCRGRGRS